MAARVVCLPGSFDPITVGHLDVIRRCSVLFPEVLVAVGNNPAKRYLFSLDERLDQVRRVTRGTGARVEAFEGLLVDAARRWGVDALIRGVRGASDVELELRNGQANRELSGVETLFVLTAPPYAHVSSSLVREIAGHGGDVSRYVPPEILDDVRQRARR